MHTQELSHDSSTKQNALYVMTKKVKIPEQLTHCHAMMTVDDLGKNMLESGGHWVKMWDTPCDKVC